MVSVLQHSAEAVQTTLHSKEEMDIDIDFISEGEVIRRQRLAVVETVVEKNVRNK